MTPSEVEELKRQEAKAWGNHATADWRSLPDATGKTHWDYEEEKRTGVVKPVTVVQGEHEVTVAAIPQNKRMVEAYDENSNRVQVEVGDNSNFAIGDKLKVGPHESGFIDVFRLLSGVPQDRRR